ncbi:unnamed protein product [Prorocentrum cordatum]|uniref:Uncharacterized protein n=1 Tax=Prorocentrum cordatum TaxID=2364126 RepID=A0ABN9PAP9_9DINO|nr:unnamed protein product [Polarella glacialis]
MIMSVTPTQSSEPAARQMSASVAGPSSASARPSPRKMPTVPLRAKRTLPIHHHLGSTAGSSALPTAKAAKNLWTMIAPRMTSDAATPAAMPSRKECRNIPDRTLGR